jgi:hypothetical protein
VKLLNAKTDTVRTIDRSAAEALVTRELVLAFDGRGIGVRGYRFSGRRRFQALKGEHVARVEIAGRFAYARGNRGVAIINTRSGKVVHRSRSSFRGDLITEPSRP